MAQKSRRKAREAALRALYQIDVGGLSPANALQGDPERADVEVALEPYTEELVNGIFERRGEIDRLVAPLVTDWDYSRLAVVDKNLLRIAAYELFHVPVVPPAVSINEAIELAKKYSTAESGRFINGVLGKLLTLSPKANWDPSAVAAEVEVSLPEEPQQEIEEIREGSPEARELLRMGGRRVQPEDSKA